jgi:hypothetical protein
VARARRGAALSDRRSRIGLFLRTALRVRLELHEHELVVHNAWRTHRVAKAEHATLTSPTF